MGRQIYAERQRHTRREDSPESDEPLIHVSTTRERYGEIGGDLMDLLNEVDLVLSDQDELGAGADPSDEDIVDDREPVDV